MTVHIQDTLDLFNAGIFMKQVDQAAKQIALAVLQNGDRGRKGKLSIELTITQLNPDTGMLNIEHAWKMKLPTLRGDKYEDAKSVTAVCVSPEGEMTLYPLEQTDLFKQPLAKQPLLEPR